MAHALMTFVGRLQQETANSNSKRGFMTPYTADKHARRASHKSSAPALAHE